MERKCPVPHYQRPINEYNDLKNALDFTWTTEDSSSFFKIILLLLLFLISGFSCIFIFPKNSDNSLYESLLQVLISSVTSFIILILRFYLAWKYIYTRLMNSTITYEESGWYDGQTWVKSTDVMIKDRLLGTYELLPILHRLEQLLFFSLLILAFCSMCISIYD